MDLGISGKRALVAASSKGLGRGCAEALAAAGCDLVMNARGSEALEQAAEEIRKAHGVKVTTVAGDVTQQGPRDELLKAAGQVDILVTNAGGPPPGKWQDWDRDAFIAALDANMLTPIALIQAMVPGMMERGWADRFRCRHRAPGRALGRHHQQPFARHPCHRPRRVAGRGRGQAAGHLDRRGARKP